MSSTAHVGPKRLLSKPLNGGSSRLRQGRRTRRMLRSSDTAAVAVLVVWVQQFISGVSWTVAGLAGLSVLVALQLAGLYRARVVADRSREWRRVAQATALAFGTVIVVAFGCAETMPRLWVLVMAAGTMLLILVNREIWRWALTQLRGARALTRRTVLVGSDSEADALAQMLADDASLGYDVVHTVDPELIDRPEVLTTTVLAAAARYEASTALVTGSGVEVDAINRLCRDLVDAGVHVEMSMSLVDIAHHRLTVRPLGRVPVVYLEPVHRTGWRPVVKRVFDLVVATVGLVTLSPLLLVIALVVKLTSKGPVFFLQERVGRDGRSFSILKFRTMVVDAEAQLESLRDQSGVDGPLFKMRHDPRVTSAGRVLRRTSLDEVPQLFNVLRGDMALVGPRPALRSEMSDWSPELYGRLRVRPGMTGLWQVSGRSETGFDEYARLDLHYIDNWSLASDLSILARTAAAVVRADGAY